MVTGIRARATHGALSVITTSRAMTRLAARSGRRFMRYTMRPTRQKETAADMGAVMEMLSSGGSTRRAVAPANRPAPAIARGSADQSPGAIAKAAQAIRMGVVCPRESAPGRSGIRATIAVARVVRSAPLTPITAVRIGSWVPVTRSRAASSTRAAEACAESWTELVFFHGVELSATAVPTASMRSSYRWSWALLPIGSIVRTAPGRTS